MKSLPALLLFFLAYYLLWLVRVPFHLFKLLLEAVAGDSE
jgi:hypothetical protein